MGSINKILKPKDWRIIDSFENKNLSNDVVYKMLVGYGEDQGYYDIYDFISKDNYDNLIDDKYHVVTFPYSEIPILLFDETGNHIPMVNNFEVSQELLTNYQMKAISEEKSNNSKVRRKKQCKINVY